MQISICGTPGSGKSTVAKIVAQKLGYKYYSVGEIRREMAKKRGLTIDEFNSLPEDTDTEFDEYQKKLGKTEDNFVIEGRLSFHFVPNSIKFYLVCDLGVAAERIYKNQRSTEKPYKSIEDAKKEIEERIKQDNQRYFKRYGLRPYHASHYDYVIDTTNISIEEVVQEILEKIKKYAKTF